MSRVIGEGLWTPPSPCTCAHTKDVLVSLRHRWYLIKIMETVKKALSTPPSYTISPTWTHSHTQSSSWLLRSYSPWQSSSVLGEQMIVSLDSE